MPIVLYRIDERLIHGQVVIGWGHELRPERYLLIDDDLASSEWEQELYRLGAAGVEVIFSAVADACPLLAEWRAEGKRSIVLARDIGAVRRLTEVCDLSGEELNLGGIHHGPGREEVLNYLHLTEQDMRDLRAIAAAGLRVSARDLPDAHRVVLESLLKE